MNFLYRLIYAAYCRGTHHKLGMDALVQLRGEEGPIWRDLILLHHEAYLDGTKTPDNKFKDFRNHVVHVQHGYWGGAARSAREWYEMAIRQFRRSKWREGVFALGVLSHYYTDPIMPFHTGQSEAEDNIHRASEWSISKSYDALREMSAQLPEIPEPVVPQGTDWLEQMVFAGARISNAYYDTLIERYDFDRGVQNPPQGLDARCREVLSGLLSYATLGLARIFERCFDESRVIPPKTDLTVESILATLQVPIQWVSRMLHDSREQRYVEAIYDELQRTGKVEQQLPDDDREVRDSFTREVLEPAESLRATRRVDGPQSLIARPAYVSPLRPAAVPRTLAAIAQEEMQQLDDLRRNALAAGRNSVAISSPQIQSRPPKSSPLALPRSQDSRPVAGSQTPMLSSGTRVMTTVLSPIVEEQRTVDGYVTHTREPDLDSDEVQYARTPPSAAYQAFMAGRLGAQLDRSGRGPKTQGSTGQGMRALTTQRQNDDDDASDVAPRQAPHRTERSVRPADLGQTRAASSTVPKGSRSPLMNYSTDVSSVASDVSNAARAVTGGSQRLTTAASSSLFRGPSPSLPRNDLDPVPVRDDDDLDDARDDRSLRVGRGEFSSRRDLEDARDRDAREREQRERNAREREARERDLREREARDRLTRERPPLELRDRPTRDTERLPLERADNDVHESHDRPRPVRDLPERRVQEGPRTLGDVGRRLSTHEQSLYDDRRRQDMPEREARPVKEQADRGARPPSREAKYYLEWSSNIVDAPSIGPKMARHFEQARIKTVADFVNANPAELAGRLRMGNINPALLKDWQDQARLVVRVAGLRGNDSQLLVAAGYRDAEDITSSTASELFGKIDAIARSSVGQRILRSSTPPDLEEVQDWIAAARQARSHRAA